MKDIEFYVFLIKFKFNLTPVKSREIKSVNGYKLVVKCDYGRSVLGMFCLVVYDDEFYCQNLLAVS